MIFLHSFPPLEKLAFLAIPGHGIIQITDHFPFPYHPFLDPRETDKPVILTILRVERLTAPAVGAVGTPEIIRSPRFGLLPHHLDLPSSYRRLVPFWDLIYPLLQSFILHKTSFFVAFLRSDELKQKR